MRIQNLLTLAVGKFEYLPSFGALQASNLRDIRFWRRMLIKCANLEFLIWKLFPGEHVKKSRDSYESCDSVLSEQHGTN